MKCVRNSASRQHGSQVSTRTDPPRSTKKSAKERNIFCVNEAVKDVCPVNEVEEKRERESIEETYNPIMHE